jgi:penicillin-insensitive murein endopeptidase
MRRWLLGLSGAISLVSGHVALAAPVATHPLAVAAMMVDHHFRMGQSVGSPTEGRLLGGSHLEEAPYLRLLPAYASEDARWGLGSLVQLIDWSARSVSRQFPDAVLSVGHLSRRGGGDIDRHASHESGRDADLSFYIRGQTSHPLYSDHMVPFRADGTAPSWPGAYFDDARNWALVSALVQEPFAHITYIFVASPLRARLLAYATRVGAPLAVRNRAAELMVQPHGSLPHDDHFHVRIGCPTGMTTCIELPTHSARAKSLVAHHSTAASSHAVLAAKATSKAPLHPATPSHTSEPLEPPPPKAHDEVATVPAVPPGPPAPPDPPPAPTNSAILAAPFDDVDGPVSAGLAPRHMDLQ